MINDAEIEGQTYWMPDCEVGEVMVQRGGC